MPANQTIRLSHLLRWSFRLDGALAFFLRTVVAGRVVRLCPLDVGVEALCFLLFARLGTYARAIDPAGCARGNELGAGSAWACCGCGGGAGALVLVLVLRAG